LRSETLKRYHDGKKKKRAVQQCSNIVEVDVWYGSRAESITINSKWLFGEIRKELCKMFDVPDGTLTRHVLPAIRSFVPDKLPFLPCDFLEFQSRIPRTPEDQKKLVCDQCLQRTSHCKFAPGSDRCLMCICLHVVCSQSGHPLVGVPFVGHLDPLIDIFAVEARAQEELDDVVKDLVAPDALPVMDTPPGAGLLAIWWFERVHPPKHKSPSTFAICSYGTPEGVLHYRTPLNRLSMRHVCNFLMRGAKTTTADAMDPALAGMNQAKLTQEVRSRVARLPLGWYPDIPPFADVHAVLVPDGDGGGGGGGAAADGAHGGV
jgi:hypothetical protein